MALEFYNLLQQLAQRACNGGPVFKRNKRIHSVHTY